MEVRLYQERCRIGRSEAVGSSVQAALAASVGIAAVPVAHTAVVERIVAVEVFAVAAAAA